MMASQALADASRCDTGQMPQMRAIRARHLVERAALGELLKSTHLRHMKMRVFHLTLAVQLDGDLAVPFKAGYGIDRDGLAHRTQAPKRVRAGISSGSPVIQRSQRCMEGVGRRRAAGKEHVNLHEFVDGPHDLQKLGHHDAGDLLLHGGVLNVGAIKNRPPGRSGCALREHCP